MLLDGHVEPKSYLLQCFEVLEHSWISQCNGSIIPNTFPLDLIQIKTIHKSGGKMKHRYVHVVYNYCIPFVASNTHIPAVVVPATKLRQPNPYSTYTVLFRVSSSQLTSILSVTCFVAVLWPDLRLQWRSKNCGRHCSGGYTYMQTVTDFLGILEEQTFR